MGVVTSAVVMAAGLATTAIGGMNDYNTAKGAGALSDAQGYADDKAIKRMISNTEETDRQERARERVNAYAQDTGGGQDQPLMSRAITVNQQALDIAEIQLSGKAKVRKSKMQSLLFDNQAKGAVVETLGTTAVQGYKGYQAFRDAT